ncbi:MAG: hypothetical protein R2862_03260 [Thermoanaerobaculia bacterium]
MTDSDGEPTAIATAADGTNGEMLRLLRLLALLVLVAIPLRVLAAGWLPRDDVRRHAAKAVSGRDWSEVLVLRPGVTVDEHPGWHATLGALHALGADSTRAVAMAAIALAATLFLVVPLARFRHPAAWLAALATVALFDPRFYPRLLSGRPLVLSMTALVLLLTSWRSLCGPRASRRALAAFTLLFAVVCWCHGNWYLWLFPIGVVFLAGKWRAARRLAGCFVAGTALGALATGHPVDYLVQWVRVLLWALAGGDPQPLLASEFQPAEVNAAILLVVGGLLLWKRPPLRRLLTDPAFLTLALAWLLGLRWSRFDSDWAMPALLVWIATLLDESWQGAEWRAPRNALAVGFAAAVLFLAVTGNRGGRWTTAEEGRHLAASDPAIAPWLPAAGGILYSNSMGLFYDTFFENPHAPWRYVLGFEPGLMPPDELAVLRATQRSGAADASFLPWVAKMRPEDRLVIARADPRPPAIDALDWATPFDGLWIGRPRPAAP